MSSTTHPGSTPRPRSPWTGSRHQTQHRWQLDGATSLSDVTTSLMQLAAELTAAHRAGWWLAEPMRGGHLIAARASRRQRGRQDPPRDLPGHVAPPRTPPWRLRVVDEPATPGFEVYDATSAPNTPVLEQTGHELRQVSGPPLEPDVLDEVARQAAPTGPTAPSHRLWGVAPARVGPNVDLVAHGSALRLHAVRDGALVRTCEALTFQHAADDAADLLQAAAAYQLLAQEASTMAAAGGHLVSCDDGLLLVTYDDRQRITAQNPIGSPA